MEEQNRESVVAHGERQIGAADQNGRAAEGSSCSGPVDTAAGQGGPPDIHVGIVAVVWGKGFEEILKRQGVQAVVSGDQSMNPSAGELVEAVESLHAEHVIVLPNNKDVLLSAQQAASLSTKNVAVLPTASLPEAVAATFHFNSAMSLDENVAAMTESFQGVRVGEITFAARDTTMNGASLRDGDVIGLSAGTLVSSGSELAPVLLSLTETLQPEPGELITLYAGEDVDGAVAENHRQLLAEAWPQCDVELYVGGQPVYTYWVAVE